MSDEAHAAASKIQRVFRGKKGRNEYQQILHEKLVKAATRIQRGWRNKMAENEEELKLMDQAARRIQNQFRIRLARKRAVTQEKFGPRALPPYVESFVIPPVRHLAEKITELLVSPTPYAAARRTGRVHRATGGGHGDASERRPRKGTRLWNC